MNLFYIVKDDEKIFIGEVQDIPTAMEKIKEHQKKKAIFLAGRVEVIEEPNEIFLIVKKTGCKYQIEK